MTVGELKLALSKISDDTEVVITSVDPTDYTYINDINSVEQGYLNIFEDGESFIMEEIDDSDIEDIEAGIMNITEVVILDGGNV
jgi:hypothetical protein